MLRQVEVGTGVNALHFFETERHLELNVGGGVCVMRQLLMVVVTVFLIAQPEILMPCQTHLAPVVEPFHLFAGTYKELHFHLLELTHTEYELARHNLVAESLSDLSYTERYAHTSGFLDVEIVHEDTLGCLGTQINLHGSVGGGSHLGLEHQIELTDIRPVARAADRIYNLVVQYYLFQLVEIVGVHGFRVTLVQLVAFGLMLKHAAVSLAELRLVESIAETLCGFRHFLVDLLIKLGDLILYQHIGAVTLLAVAIVDQRIVEGIDVS